MPSNVALAWNSDVSHAGHSSASAALAVNTPSEKT